jgi:biotin carboxylase
MRRIAIVHHRRSFFPLDLRQSIGADLQPIWVLPQPDSAAPPLRRLLRRAGPVVDVGGLDIDRAVALLAAERPDGIITFVDDAHELTAALAARLSLRYLAEDAAHVVADKGRQRAALRAAGVAGPRFWTIPAGVQGAALAKAAREVVYPAVLKPTAGSGGRGIRWLSAPEELVALYEPDTPVVVEEYLSDTADRDLRFASYLSVESAVSHGQISHVALCGRFPLASPFRETGFFLPAAVDPSRHAPLLRLAEAAIRSLAITTGMMHTEIKLSSAGPRVIEVNPRLGGRPPMLLRSVSETNLFRMACLIALGDEVSFSELVPTREIGFCRLIQPPDTARSVRAVRGVHEVSCTPGVDQVILSHPPGDPVDWREGSAGQVVAIHGRVPDLGALAETIDFIDRTVEIDYAGEPTAAPSAAVVTNTR